MAYTPKSPETYQGNQIVLNSDRLLFNSKTDSILLFSNKVMGFSTRGSFHFDTSSDEGESKFVINSPKIYLGLEFNNDLPKQSAVLADDLISSLVDILDLIAKVYLDIATNVSYLSTSPGTPTGVHTMNIDLMHKRLRKIEKVKGNFQDIKSKNTKLV
tara:strand:- start:10 stop:483 length:474 start_codon:yes stop_codon:yes gene_type:complete